MSHQLGFVCVVRELGLWILQFHPEPMNTDTDQRSAVHR